MTYYIYMITSPSEKSYIGQTGNFKIRMYRHKSDAFNKKCDRYNYPIYNAIRKYGWLNMQKKVLIKCEEFDADYYETNCIRIYKTLAPNGYNLETGGNKNKTFSEVSKENERSSKG